MTDDAPTLRGRSTHNQTHADQSRNLPDTRQPSTRADMYMAPTASGGSTITPLEAYGAPRPRSASFNGRKSDPKAVFNDAPAGRTRRPSPARQQDYVPPNDNNDITSKRPSRNERRRATGPPDSMDALAAPVIEPAPQRDPERWPGRDRRNGKRQVSTQKGTPLSDWLSSAKQDSVTIPSNAPPDVPELRSPSWADNDPEEPDEQFSDFASEASAPSPSTDGYNTPIAERVKAAASACVDIYALPTSGKVTTRQQPPVRPIDNRMVNAHREEPAQKP